MSEVAIGYLIGSFAVMLWLIMLALITRFKERQIDVKDFKKLLEELKDERIS